MACEFLLLTDIIDFYLITYKTYNKLLTIFRKSSFFYLIAYEFVFVAGFACERPVNAYTDGKALLT